MELLVVVAIAVVLMAILIPSMQRAIELGQTAKCGTNLRALGMATLLYADDHTLYFPGGGFGMRRPNSGAGYNFEGADANGQQHSWHTDANGETGIKPVAGNANYPGGSLWKYASKEETFICPSYSGLFSQPAPKAHLDLHTAIERSPGLSYSVTWALHEAIPDRPWFKKINGPWDDNGVKRPYNPAETLIYCEESLTPNGNGTGAKNDAILLASRKIDPSDIVDEIGDFHMPGTEADGAGRSNVLFGDNHVSVHSSKETKNLAWPGMLTP